MTSKVKESLRKGPLGCGYLNMFQDGGKEQQTGKLSLKKEKRNRLKQVEM